MIKARNNNCNNSIVLIELFNNIIKKTKSEISCINNGGCGFFAYYFVTALKQYGVNATIARLEDYDSFNWWKKDFEEFKKIEKKERYYSNLSASHFMVKVGKIYIDGRKCVELIDYRSPSKIKKEVLEKKFNFSKITGYYTLEEMKLALEYGNWNTMYNTGQNKRLKKIIDIECQKFFN